ncbi:hypothetical protein SYNTR_0419 [Candidatus Syntrophocurvum alkaliphilum]|uniref:2Fe-2S ferredoxin-type domain-containing protein n=1 Tax=Candidatus Syntrophocurvum alkaliphilum TaxID=2293317 RepID=A0A6I6DE12_9FIRM|nr:ASKHA domain-containing protein [Candidatus Syntrophocurvum alkaliphilum]QGT99012.1 hypothetical protein SYNTR_0419 [Candidatus Syntrophocurvum alkaliphilum]
MSEQVKLTIVFPDGSEENYFSEKGDTLWKTLEIIGVDTGGICGGTGICGKCKTKVEGAVSPVSQEEKQHLLPDEIKMGERLACYYRVDKPLTVVLNKNDNLAKSNLKLKFYNEKKTHENNIKVKKIFINGLDANSPVTLQERLLEGVNPYFLMLNPDNYNELVKLDRAGRPTLELYAVILDDKVIPNISKEKENIYGLAIDIGSTTISGALINLENGELVGLKNVTNMQRVYGEDILSRVAYSTIDQSNKDRLQKLLINNINSLIDSFQKNVCAQNIYKVVVVGNPVMLHFLSGLDVSGFGSSPFVGVIADEFVLKANSIGLNVNEMANMILLPQLGGFVGADTTACMLNLPYNSNSNFLLIDIGTNGEIVLCKNRELWATSAAAGPAFEGGSLKCGTRAIQGSIDRVFLQDRKFRFNVIGNTLAKGICGSGVIDLIACLRQVDCLDENGVIKNNIKTYFDVLDENNYNEIVIINGESTYNGYPIIFTQEDIRQVQLAKAAIRSAVEVLMTVAKLDYKDLDNIYLAGAFGSFIDPENAIKIGLLPNVAKNKIKNIGNAALDGAILALINKGIKEKAKDLKNITKIIDLANTDNFNDIYIKNIGFTAKS